MMAHLARVRLIVTAVLEPDLTPLDEKTKGSGDRRKT
jgi:hypothetical protein